MGLVRACRKCGKLIPYKEKYCDECKVKYEFIRKDNMKVYDKYQRNKDSKRIYDSKEWKALTKLCKDRFQYIDVYQYYINNVIVYGEICHHIIEIVEDGSRIYDLDNLIYLSSATHNYIHGLYKRDKEATQSVLFKLVERWKIENCIG
ncbi:hypothetical protein AN1V17_11680 [Vallitalea sediminicola]